VSPPLYQRVALKRDVPEHDLKSGDVAVLVDYVAHGESIAVVAVPESAIEDLRANEVLAVRPLADAI
jgi:hypothetical protein